MENDNWQKDIKRIREMYKLTIEIEVEIDTSH